MASNQPTSDDASGRPASESDLSDLRKLGKRLIEAIAAEPVSEKLRRLADELENALDDHQTKKLTEKASAHD